MNIPLLDRIYHKEHAPFREHVCRAGEFEDMWGHLNRMLLPPGGRSDLRNTEVDSIQRRKIVAISCPENTPSTLDW